jgi:hypothetical protein
VGYRGGKPAMLCLRDGMRFGGLKMSKHLRSRR